MKMDTGSGKTEIAIMRIAEELKKPESHDRFVWFLCPTVSLSEQQYSVLQVQLPAVKSLLLLGRDGVDLWKTDGKMWVSVLKDYQVVVSTYQILFDALSHSFVTMSRLSLLVVDEAHHCCKGNPLNRVMQEFYHAQKAKNAHVPAILGLTATPVVKSKISDLFVIEANLDAISRTPNRTAAVLDEYVQRPDAIPIIYSMQSTDKPRGLFDHFEDAFESFDVLTDPWVKHLTSQAQDAYKAIMCGKTWCQEQLRSVEANARILLTDIGVWACDQFLIQCHSKVVVEAQRMSLDPSADTVRNQEVEWLHKLFQGASIPSRIVSVEPNRSNFAGKTLALLEILKSQMTSKSAAIIFVETKATVFYLEKLLKAVQNDGVALRIGKLVGLSNERDNSGKISKVMAPDNGIESSIQDLRTGLINLLICTSVAEEGLDISACNVVVCFSRPASLKAFVQRRGRARAKNSKYLILCAEHEVGDVQKFLLVETEMKELYSNEMRVLQEKEREDSVLEVNKRFEVASTGALITADEAVAHLYHFCAVIPHTRFSKSRPVFTFHEDDGSHACTVTLPSMIDVSIRIFKSSTSWKTEQQAKKDAAFVAYVALYEAGLVNDNLLPSPMVDGELAEDEQDVEHKEGLTFVDAVLDPMEMLATAWMESSVCYAYRCEIPSHGAIMYMFLPTQLRDLPDLQLFITRETIIKVNFLSEEPLDTASVITWASRTTKELLHAIFQSRMEKGCTMFPVLFSPKMSADEAELWISEGTGLANISELWALETNEQSKRLIRQRHSAGRPLVFAGIEDHLAPAINEEGIRIGKELQRCIKCTKLPARTDFLHPIKDPLPTGKDHVRYIPMDAVVMERMALEMTFFVSLIPSIMHHVGRKVLVQDLCGTLLKQIGEEQQDLVRHAITASSASEPDYQRLEFLGDAVLGFCVSITLLAQYPQWHEGYLTIGKSHLVSNVRLAKAAKLSGLAKYILTKAFTGAKWRPPHNDQYQKDQTVLPREMSTKTLADVVEAIIGVAYHSDGVDASFKMIETFLGPLSATFIWHPLAARTGEIQQRTRQVALMPHLEPLQQLVGHVFREPALLIEAITHGSCQSTSTSYERLEFVGDSILSLLVTQAIFNCEPAMPAHDMHLLRTAAVNGHFLAFVAMRTTVEVTANEIVRPEQPDWTREDRGYSTTEVGRELSLHDFILHAPSWPFTNAVAASLSRFHKYREAIQSALTTGTNQRYPWLLLARFAPEKFFNDIVESMLCALLIDSKGDMAPCSAFLHKLGIMDFLTHAIGSGMRMLQPKQELNMLLSDKVKYEMVKMDDEGAIDGLSLEEIDEGLVDVCRLYRGEEWWCSACGQGRFEAETRVAAKALDLYGRERGMELD